MREANMPLIRLARDRNYKTTRNKNEKGRKMCTGVAGNGSNVVFVPYLGVDNWN